MRNKLKNILNTLPYIRSLYSQANELRNQVEEYNRNACFPPGHYYSPIISVKEVKEREHEIWKGVNRVQIDGIEINTDEQLALIKEFRNYYSELPFGENKKEGLRYYFNNTYYCHTDAITLYSVIRHYRPKRIIEVGSGFSSAVMLDTKQYFVNDLELTFIEPYPDRLFSLLTEEDKMKSKVIVQYLQKVDASNFDQLGKNDILFIDSTHVSKTGSDVNYILFEILPRIKSGVLIHFHDVFYPFEYPKEWVSEGRNWNEDYLLRAFLLYNKSFEIKVFVDFLHRHFKDIFSEMPLFYKNTGGSLWLQKL